jgi:flagellar assembly protein FliH
MSSSPELFEFAALAPVAGPAVASTAAERALGIVEGARAEAAAIHAQAEAEGRAAGFAAGMEDARAALENQLPTLAAVGEALAAEREAFLAAAERHAVELALQIAEKVVSAALATDPDAVLAVVTGALRRTASRDRLPVQVNPRDFELVRGAAEGIAARLGGIGRLEVVSERRVTPGGCVVTTGDGEIDAQPDEQLARVRELFGEAAGFSEAAGAGDG